MHITKYTIHRTYCHKFLHLLLPSLSPGSRSVFVDMVAIWIAFVVVVVGIAWVVDADAEVVDADAEVVSPVFWSGVCKVGLIGRISLSSDN